jgi:ABC-type thiamine transport system substrate-binding protein
VAEIDVTSAAHIMESELDVCIKYAPNGAVVERKSHLCACRDQRCADVYYGEEHTTMAAADCTHLLLAEAGCRHMHIHQVHVEASLDTSVFIGPVKDDP